MADAVERLMEDMLPELEDLVKRELFNQVRGPTVLPPLLTTHTTAARAKLSR
jgi:hypothetical protein